MTDPAKRMVAELLARRLGMDAGDLGTALGSDPITAMFALSMMGQAAPRRGEAEAEAVERLARVGAIVGACPICLGGDPDCIECLGQGVPGAQAPDRTALLRWIGPALRRAGLALTALPQRQPAHTDPKGDEA